jgi:poly(A) polymerase
MRRAAQKIVVKLRQHGYEAFFAGGWVRDHLLRRKPQDIDIATSAHPEDVLGIFLRATPIGARFGVVQVRMYNHPYDVATFRTEGLYVDGRHPSMVDFSGPEQDALRRDFTVNGLFYDPLADRVIDYVGGVADIRRRTLRTIGAAHARFGEDRLRMLRAIRLACNLDFEIEPETLEAIKQLAPHILEVSWERIRDELLKILAGPMPDRGLNLLHSTGLLINILPEVEAMRDIPQPAEYHPEGDVFVHTGKALGLLRKPSPVLALATLLHDVGKPPTFAVKDRIRFDRHADVGARIAEDVCRRLRMSNDETARVIELVRDHLQFLNLHEMRRSTLKRFLARLGFAEHLELHRVDCLSSNGDLQTYRFAREKFEELKLEPTPPTPVITGRDLISMGYKPGPLFGRILRLVEDYHLENPQLTIEAAREYVRRTFPRKKSGGET